MELQQSYDVVIVGSGVAGLYAALQFDKKVKVLIITKRDVMLCNSSLAQGGVAAVLDRTDDDFRLHIADTLIAGGYENNIDAVRVLVTEGPDDVRKIIGMGVEFDEGEDGQPLKTLEGGHSRRRIVHHKDQTGFEMVEKLQRQVRMKENIDILENTMVCNMERIKHGFRLDLLCGMKPDTVFASYCILATGGIGRVYSYTTNSAIATGDGIRLAYEMGAQIRNLSYVQFHPTAFAAEAERERFLISEAVRGEGAYLLNCDYERFMHRYDERGELAPRDVVSKAIMLESRRTGSDRFYLDITHKDRNFIYNRFPAISSKCLEEGIDMAKDFIPIYPCQHYLMGGIAVDLESRTRIYRLYACGECSCTGVHGKNRLASNSLLEALVFGRRAAQSIAHELDMGYAKVQPYAYQEDYSGAPLPHGMRTEIREIMQNAYFVIPDYDAVQGGLQRISEILKRLKNGKFAVTPDYCEALSLATIAYIILSEVNEK